MIMPRDDMDSNKILSMNQFKNVIPATSGGEHETDFKSSLGSNSTRVRAGTLPSKFNSNNCNSLPGMDILSSSSSLSIDKSLESSPSAAPATSEFGDAFVSTSKALAFSGRRLRSGSLFGVESKLWRSSSELSNSKQDIMVDLPISVPSVKHQASIQHLQQNISDFSRVRSYTTTNALSEKQYYLPYESQQDVYKNKQADIPLNSHVQNNSGYYPNYEKNSSNVDSLLSNVLEHRSRSQTYSIGTNNTDFNGNEYYNNVINNSISNSSNKVKPDFIIQGSTILIDNVNKQDFEFSSTFEMSTLAPSDSILIMNLPPLNIGVSNAQSIYKLTSRFGKVSGVYVILDIIEDEKDKRSFETINEDAEYNTANMTVLKSVSALVQFESIEVAMHTKAQLNHKELYPKYSAVIGFAKISKNKYAAKINESSVDNMPSSSQNRHEAERRNLLITSGPKPLQNVVSELKDIVDQFGVSANEMIQNAINYKGFDNEFGPLFTPKIERVFDTARLREIKKLIDNNELSSTELEKYAIEMQEEIAELSSDFLGNTIVQRIFEVCNEEVKELLLKPIAPYLSQMGIHKNGTWAGQKIVNVANTPGQKEIIRVALLPYVAPLLKDGFGNYLVQGCLNFGSPYNNFLFEALCSKFWLVAQDKYGSRAIRAVLESKNCTHEQTVLLTSMIVVYSEYLAINNNGSLLLTWYLDTCTLKDRYMILTKKLLPWLVELCYNKLGSLVVLKILNNRNDPEPAKLILKEIYGDIELFSREVGSLPKAPDTLRQILKEFTYGPTFLQKSISTPIITDNNLRAFAIEQIRSVLIDMKVTPFQQQYKRLMEEVGLSAKEVPKTNISRNGSNFFINTQGSSSPVNSRFNNIIPQQILSPYGTQTPNSFQFSNGGMPQYAQGSNELNYGLMNGLSNVNPYLINQTNFENRNLVDQFGSLSLKGQRGFVQYQNNNNNTMYK